MGDYRNTSYCKEIQDILCKKKDLKQIIKNEHPRLIDMHTVISSNSGQFKGMFLDIYNYKCSYCGVSTDIVTAQLFEIDHFISRKSECFNGSDAAAGCIENLVPACKLCNGKKSDFSFSEEEICLFHPDKNNLKFIFRRDELYYIKINDEYKDNKTVNDFYEQLLLGSEIRRIDYLLLNLIGLNKKLEKKNESYSELKEAIILLIRKRNNMVN